jgi:hypothetical protein
MSRKCGSVQNYFRQVDLYPELRRNQATLDAQTRSRSAEAPTIPGPIPLVVHILYNDPADNINDDQVASQLDVLNEDFGGGNSDLGNVPEPFQGAVGNSQLTFVLAENGITRRQTEVTEFPVDDSMKAEATGGTDPWDTTRYLNIWVCRMSGSILGYAQFPGGDPATDGVVILTSAFGRGGTAAAPFDLGRTTTHEVGHYLNLSHIWGEERISTCADTDFVDDTPNQLGPNFGTPTFPSTSCPAAPNGDMFMNYMDYVDDNTMYMFTKEQVTRMHAALEFSRGQLGGATPAPDAAVGV